MEINLLHIFIKKLGKIMWDHCGMSRSADGLKSAIKEINSLKDDFFQNLKVSGKINEYNQSLETAYRVSDFIDFAKLMCYDALERNESCGGHFRVEYKTKEGEAQRDDENFCHVSAWAYKGIGNKPMLHKEKLTFENITLSQRNYK